MNAIESSAALAASNTSPIVCRDVRRSLRLAISDPGAFLARGDNYQEPLIDWQARAVLVAVEHAMSVATEYECPLCNVWARWTHGKRVDNGGPGSEFWCQSCGATVFLAVCDRRTGVATLQAENERLHKELASLKEDLSFLRRNTLPEARRKAEWQEGGKKRWRTRAETAEARVAELTALLEQARAEARTAITEAGA